MKSPVIKVENITKLFSVYHKSYDALLDLLPYFSSKIQKHTALDNVSFEVYKGEFLGIIGQNGSGKSTLLKLLCGVLHQTSGEIVIKGKILSLLELGTGFNPDLTGRENLFVSASLMGFNTKLITERIADIEAFTDIDEYFDAPVKTYSSGMYVRLAMAMFLHLEPEIFIIDEALSVGDIFFQQKCFAKIEEMRQRGVTFILVSHDLGLIGKVCDKVVFLQNGRLIYFGDRSKACKLYYESHISNNLVRSPIALNIASVAMGSPLVNILSVVIKDEYGNETTKVKMMEKLIFEFDLQIDPSVDNPGLSILIRNRTGLLVSNVTNTLKGRGYIQAVLEIFFTIEAGEYSFDINMGNRLKNSGIKLLELKNVGIINVDFDYNNEIAPFVGLAYMKNVLNEK